MIFYRERDQKRFKKFGYKIFSWGSLDPPSNIWMVYSLPRQKKFLLSYIMGKPVDQALLCTGCYRRHPTFDKESYQWISELRLIAIYRSSGKVAGSSDSRMPYRRNIFFPYSGENSGIWGK